MNCQTGLLHRHFEENPRNVTFLLAFRTSPRFSFTSPSSQPRERSQVALFLLSVVSPGSVYEIVIRLSMKYIYIYLFLVTFVNIMAYR